MTPRFLLRHLLPLLIVGLSGAGLVGCDDDPDAPPAAGLSGDWEITQTYSTGTTQQSIASIVSPGYIVSYDPIISETIIVNITQDGNSIGGSSSQGTLEGSISGTNLQFTITTRVPAEGLSSGFSSRPALHEFEDNVLVCEPKHKVFKGVVIDDKSLAGTFEKKTSSGSLVQAGSWVANRLSPVQSPVWWAWFPIHPASVPCCGGGFSEAPGELEPGRNRSSRWPRSLASAWSGVARKQR